ncbi:MAG: hypothetical protein F4093_07445 [Gammaproteobacteria bacterium]|nr:hypothetical protein [Gammaproteobacteria bacterium]MYJ52479.1 hypothetical protein [Gammaproteobacteria bacterium]
MARHQAVEEKQLRESGFIAPKRFRRSRRRSGVAQLKRLFGFLLRHKLAVFFVAGLAVAVLIALFA